MNPSVPSVLFVCLSVCHSGRLSVSVSPQSKLENRIMPTTLAVFYLTEDLEVRSYGYLPANKHSPEDNFLRNITPYLLVNSLRSFNESFCRHVQRTAVKEDRAHDTVFVFCPVIILYLHCQFCPVIILYIHCQFCPVIILHLHCQFCPVIILYLHCQFFL